MTTRDRERLGVGVLGRDARAPPIVSAVSSAVTSARAERAADRAHDRVDAGRDARPRAGRRAPTMRFAIDANANAMPTPMRTFDDDELRTASSCATASIANDSALTTRADRQHRAEADRGCRAAPRAGRRRASRSTLGTMSRPACGHRHAEAVARDSSASARTAGPSRNEPNIATPMRKPVRFVASTGPLAPARACRRAAGVVRSSRTRRTRSRTATPPASAADDAARAPAPGVRLRDAEQQRGEAERQERRRRPSRSRVRSRGGRRRDEAPDARTRRAAPAGRSRTARRCRCCRRSTPDSGRPMPPPMPNIAEIRPIATARLSAGSSSLMIPNASGKTPPATPWIDAARR